MEPLLFPDKIKMAKRTSFALEGQLIQRQREQFHKEEYGCTELSARELYIVKLLYLGMDPKEIADFYSVSVFTIKTHFKNIHEVLDIHKQTDLVVWYCRKKLNGDGK